MSSPEFACVDDGVDDLLAAVAGIGDEHAGRPVDPVIAASVVDLEAFGVIPHDRRLAAHRHRFEAVQLFKSRDRFRNRQLGSDTPQARVDGIDCLRR